MNLQWLNTDIRVLRGGQQAARLSKKELAVFCRNMYFMLDAGHSVKTAATTLAGQAVSGRARPHLARMHRLILQGESLSGAMANGPFPPFVRELCHVGELSGGLPKVMAQLAEYYDRQARADEEMTAALVYPSVVAVMMLAVIVVAVTFVLPNYALVFAASGVPLPALTRTLIGISDGLIAHAYLSAAVAVLLPVAVAAFFKSPPGKAFTARFCLYAPVVRTVCRKNVSLRYAQAMYVLLDAGLSPVNAARAAADVVGNRLAQSDLRRLAAGLEEGRAFWLLLSETAYLDPMLSGLAQVGEETGRLPATMEKCYLYCQREAEVALRRVTKLVEPAVTIVLGLLLGLVMLAVMLPTFALTDVV